MASTLKVDTIVHPTGTPNNLTLDNAGNVTIGNNLTVTGTTTLTTPLAVAQGGTGRTSLTAGYIPYGNGTSAFGVSPIYTDGTSVGIGISSLTLPAKVEIVYASGTEGLGLALTNTIAGGYGSGTSFYSVATDTTKLMAGQVGMLGTTSWSNTANASSAMLFKTINGGTLSEKMRIASDGAVAIGSTTTSNGKFSTYITTDGGTALFTRLTGATNNPYFIVKHTESGGVTTLDGNSSTTAYNLALATGGTERARIDQYGSLLVGTTTSPTTTAGLGTISTPGTVVMGSSFKRNRIINGNMAIDQRSAGASYAVTTTTSYGSCDRWVWLAGANSVFTAQRVSTSNSDFPYALRVQRTASSTSTQTVYYSQIIETINCQDLAGQTVTLSFYATAGANYSATSSALTYQLCCGTGTDQGSNSLNTGSWTGASYPTATATVTTTRTRFSTQITVPAGTNELAFRFYWAGTGTAGANDYVDITGVQLEVGSIATPYERQIYSDQLAQCQRYYWRAYSSADYTNFAIGRAYSTTNGTATLTLPQPMRGAPTFASSTPTGNFSYSITALSLGQYTNDYRIMTLAVTGAFATNAAFSLENATGTGTTVYLALSAEL